MVQEQGADALRFALARQAGEGQNIPLGTDYIEAARRFANKIWNAARLVLQARDGLTGPPVLPPQERWALSDRWLLSRHQTCLAELDAALESYRFSDAAQVLQRFVWSELCDWGIEAAKPRLYGGSPGERGDAAAVLAWVLERSLRLLHPFMPFVTEEIWQRFGAGESIVIAPWPQDRPDHRDAAAEERFGLAQAVIGALRKFRKVHGLRDSLPLAARVVPAEGRRGILEAVRQEVERLATVSSLEVADAPGDTAGAARLVAGGAQIFVPLAGILDPEVERARLRRRLADLAAERDRASGKLANPSFVEKAPAEVVAKEQAKLTELEEEAAILGAQLAELG